jgi:hypothetical protein
LLGSHLAAFALDDDDERRTETTQPPPGGYALPQIGASMADHARAAAGPRKRQAMDSLIWKKRAPRRDFDLNADELTRPPANPNAAVLKEFGLPYVPGVPLAAILIPPPPYRQPGDLPR